MAHPVHSFSRGVLSVCTQSQQKSPVKAADGDSVRQ